MKTLTYTIAIFMAVATSSAYAHHPSEGVSPNFDLVTEQLEAVESPHLDMDMDTMGSISAVGDSEMATATRGQAGWTSGAEDSQAGTMTLEQPQDGMGPAAAAGTIDLMENAAQ